MLKLFLFLSLLIALVHIGHSYPRKNYEEEEDDENTAPEAYALTKDGKLIGFHVDEPKDILFKKVIRGLNEGEKAICIDRQPSTGRIFLVAQDPEGGFASLYTLDVDSSSSSVTATLVGPGTTGIPFISELDIGCDFNPVVNLIRVSGETQDNYRINPTTGSASIDQNLNYVPVPVPAIEPVIRGAAYTMSYSGNATVPASTVLYVIDTQLDALVRQNPPNNGTLTVIGSLGVDAVKFVGFDIFTDTNGDQAFATLTVGKRTGLYSINLSTGAAELVGNFPKNFKGIRGLTLVAPGTIEESSSNRKSSKKSKKARKPKRNWI